MSKNLKPILLIREKVSLGPSVILGIVPIFALWFLWFLVTFGKSDVVVLPDGIIEEETTAPRVGMRVVDRTHFRIPNAALEQIQIGTDSYEFVVTTDNASYSLGDMGARQRKGETSVSVLLKEGAFIGAQEVKVDLLETGDGPEVVDEPSKTVSRGGVTLPPPPVKITRKILWNFRYEQVQTRWFSPTILPSPGDVVRSFHSLWHERGLLQNVKISFFRVGIGFFVAFLFAFPLGILMGTFSKIRAMFSPLVVFGGYLPIPALVPLSMALFGLTETQKVMFLALGFVIYLLPIFVKAIESVDNVYLQTAYTLGANRFQVMTKVLLGIAWPDIFDAMRMGFGVGWGYIILAEMVDMGNGGVGASILISQRRGPIAHVYLILVAIVSLAFVTDKLWQVAGEYLFPYRSLKR